VDAAEVVEERDGGRGGVRATLHELRGTHAATAAVPLFNDLGGIHFTTC